MKNEPLLATVNPLTLGGGIGSFSIQNFKIMSRYKRKNRHTYLLQYHIVFVCKYRKKLLEEKWMSNDIKWLSYQICKKHGVYIKYMETDKDHIHYMVETDPTMSISKLVNLLKSYTTYHILRKHPYYLCKRLYGKRTFWNDGYFACSVGNVSEKILKEYIESQGKEEK